MRDDSRRLHLLFLDESGKPDEAMFAVGGVAIRADEWELLRRRWEQMLSRHSRPSDKELKWHGTKTGEVAPALADAVYATLAEAPVTCFVTVLRALAGKQAHPELFASAEDTYATALNFLAERFQRFLSRAESHGMIILDSRRREVDDRMRRLFDRLQREGTPFSELDRIVDSLLLGPSHMSLGLQVADLVVGATLAAQRAPGDASRWFKQLRSRFALHPDTGELEGVGLKTFPPRAKGEEPALAKLFQPMDPRA